MLIVYRPCKNRCFIKLISIGGRDFTNMDTTIILLPNESKKDICVTIKEDLTLEESEIFYCSLSISQGSEVIAQVTSSQAIVTIVDNDGKHKQSACA